MLADRHEACGLGLLNLPKHLQPETGAMSYDGISKKIDRQVKSLQVICSGFASSLLVYAGLAWTLVEVLGFQAIVELDPTIRTTIAVVALATLPAAEMLTRMLRAKAATVGQETGAEVALQSYSQAVIVGFAMREACGVIGLVLSLLTGSWLWAVTLSAVALVAMLVAWPRSHSVEEWLLQQPGARRR